MVGVRAGEDYTLGRDLGHAFSSPHVAFYGRDGEAKGSEGLSCGDASIESFKDLQPRVFSE